MPGTSSQEGVRIVQRAVHCEAAAEARPLAASAVLAGFKLGLTRSA